ncbi:MAG: hypothetical protein M3347_15270 [Armatimonadota bacterium]|nr:hypothetical protein [Armatimonadota bacterium]
MWVRWRVALKDGMGIRSTETKGSHATDGPAVIARPRLDLCRDAQAQMGEVNLRVGDFKMQISRNLLMLQGQF